ncbi:MAG: hypothetical protein ACTSYB_17940 [Candidatus Helarchaeota archaeon]
MNTKLKCPRCKESEYIEKGEGICPICGEPRKQYVCLECTTTFFECGHKKGFELGSSCPSDIFRNIKR